jgi:hypothetical protein
MPDYLANIELAAAAAAAATLAAPAPPGTGHGPAPAPAGAALHAPASYAAPAGPEVDPWESGLVFYVLTRNNQYYVPLRNIDICVLRAKRFQISASAVRLFTHIGCVALIVVSLPHMTCL